MYLLYAHCYDKNMKKRTTNIARFLFGLLGLSAILTEAIVTILEGSFQFFNFFGFFTILSNIMAATLLIYLGVTKNESTKVQYVRGAVTLYMLMTGVIFALLLSNLQGVRLTAVPWDNIVLHYIMPIVVVADWIITPPKKSAPFAVVGLWLLFPIVYVMYSLIRGAFVGWYPYPFLNPGISSYTQVVITCLVITVFVVGAAVVIRLHTARVLRDSK